jgi:peptidyl-prolyl cis-trans isomerase C
MNSVKRFRVTLVALFAIFSSIAGAAQSSDDVLAETAQVKLTRADYEAALARIPEDAREEFATSPGRLTLFVNNILISKTLAAQARQAGLAPDPDVLRDEPTQVERALAAAQVKAIEETAAREFDARRSSLTVAARENYMLARDQFMRPEEIKISVILFWTEGRGNDATLSLARATRDKLIAGRDFAALAKQVSEDKGSAAEGGSLRWATADEMNPTLARTALALPRIGDISEPVAIGKSYLLVRLDGRRPAEPIPFDEVKDSILDTMRANHVKDERESRLAAIRNDPTMKVNQPALDALVRRIDIDPERYKPPVDAPAPAAAPPQK